MAGDLALASESPEEIQRELVARAKALAPLLALHAAEAERIRRPTDAVIRALAEAEILQAWYRFIANLGIA